MDQSKQNEDIILKHPVIKAYKRTIWRKNIGIILNKSKISKRLLRSKKDTAEIYLYISLEIPLWSRIYSCQNISNNEECSNFFKSCEIF